MGFIIKTVKAQCNTNPGKLTRLEVFMVTKESGRKALSVEEAGRVIGIGRSLAWGLVRDGKLRTVRAGQRVLVPVAAIDEFLAGATATEGKSDG